MILCRFGPSLLDTAPSGFALTVLGPPCWAETQPALGRDLGRVRWGVMVSVYLCGGLQQVGPGGHCGRPHQRQEHRLTRNDKSCLKPLCLGKLILTEIVN